MWRHAMILLLCLSALIGKASAGIVPVELRIDGDGKLYGARNVLVRDTLLDVSFVDGTCMSVFDGCDAWTDFPYAAFHVELASALLDQVLIGEFDTAPSRTFGCTFSILCAVATPLSVSITSDAMGWALAFNGDDSRLFDHVEAGGNAARSQLDFTKETAYVWAVWSASADRQVPEPGGAALVLIGLLALALASTRHVIRPAYREAMPA